MQRDRRSILKAVGVVSGVSVLGAGRAIAEESKTGTNTNGTDGCADTVQKWSIDYTAYASPGDTPATFVYSGDPDKRVTLTDEFAQSPFPNRRMVVTVRSDEEPQRIDDGNVSIDRLIKEGDNLIGSNAEYERMGYISSEGLLEESPKRLIIEGGETYTGPGINGEEVENEVILDDGETYRVDFDSDNTNIALSTEIEVKLQAYEPGCFD